MIQDFEAQSSDELTLWKDGVVTVLDQSVGEGWWKGDLNGKIGIFPANVRVAHRSFLFNVLAFAHCGESSVAREAGGSRERGAA